MCMWCVNGQLGPPYLLMTGNYSSLLHKINIFCEFHLVLMFLITIQPMISD